MIFYVWTALNEGEPGARAGGDRAGGDRACGDRAGPDGSGSGSPGFPVAMGITDDRGRAMKAGEETLGSGRASVVIIEVVRPGMAPRTLAPCYVGTGVGWLGRCTLTGDVTWNRFFSQGDPEDRPPPGRMGT